jgi:hypothetical protein
VHGRGREAFIGCGLVATARIGHRVDEASPLHLKLYMMPPIGGFTAICASKPSDLPTCVSCPSIFHWWSSRPSREPTFYPWVMKPTRPGVGASCPIPIFPNPAAAASPAPAAVAPAAVAPAPRRRPSPSAVAMTRSRARRPTASAIAIPYSILSLFCWSREEKVSSSTSQGRAIHREGFHGAVTIYVLGKDANPPAGRHLPWPSACRPYHSASGTSGRIPNTPLFLNYSL